MRDEGRQRPPLTFLIPHPSSLIPGGTTMAELPMDLIAHLYRRAGFGPSRQDLIQGRAAGYEATRDALLAGATDPNVDAQTEAIIEPYTRDYDFSLIDDVRSWWYLRMVNCPAPLREEMTLFWHG